METPDHLKSGPLRDEVFVVRVRVERDPGARSRVTIRHVATGRQFTSEDLADVGDFIRLSIEPNHADPS